MGARRGCVGSEVLLHFGELPGQDIDIDMCLVACLCLQPAVFAVALLLTAEAFVTNLYETLYERCWPPVTILLVGRPGQWPSVR